MRRVVVSFADSPDLVLAARIDNRPAVGFAPATPGCSQKADVVVPVNRTSRLRLDARGTLDGQPTRDTDRLRFR
jgi:hypothetical protein